MTKWIVLFLCFLSYGCTDSKTDPSIFDLYAKADRQDPHSYSQPAKAITTHLDLSLKANFDTKILSGVATWDILSNNADKIIFDIKDLNIVKVTTGNGTGTKYKISEADPFKGQALEVDITPSTKKVSIHYSTSPSAAAIQWLNPNQTADKKHPFLFTQGQAILTRTWIPCQDSPGVRISYDAHILVPQELMAVMSASNPTEKREDGMYHFKMQQPIPPYLIALAIGDLEFGKIGDRTGIYAEPSMLEKSLYEFSDMEKMLIAAEELYGPYLWDQYDVIVLPPSFPFGGMENPRLTFATPTIIAGDKSLTALIAHELAHSWSGNLVTNATWNDFWLNEGFTVYFERRIMEALYGEDYANMLAMLGYQDLEATVNDIGHNHADTHLHLNLQGRDADDGMTDIAYEKGAHMLMLLEEKVGRSKFDAFLKNYFEVKKFKTIATSEFVDYINEELIKPNNLDVNLDEWIYGPGIPKNCPVIKSDKFEQVDALVTEVTGSGDLPKDKTANWTTHEWLHFLRHLPSDLPISKMKKLDQVYDFTHSGNSEIAFAWYHLSIQNGYASSILPEIEGFLVSVGRRKFLTPLYRAFKEKGQIDIAREIYAKAKNNYHSVAISTMDALLES